MILSGEQAYSILDVIDNAILSKSGSVTLGFRLDCPECYSLDVEGIEKRHHGFFRALKYLNNEDTIVHKMDAFLRKKFDAYKTLKGDSFIQQSEKRHFNDRIYCEHTCYVFFSVYSLLSLESSYIKNPLSYKDSLTKADKAKLTGFFESVENAVTILKNLQSSKIVPMEESEVKQCVFQYVNGFCDDNGLRDIHIDSEIEIGEKKGRFFVVCDENYLPDEVPLYVPDDTLPSSNVNLNMACFEPLGVHLQCDHIINQVWKFEGSKIRDDLATRVMVYAKHQKFDDNIEVDYNNLKNFQREINEEKNVLVRSHFNVFLIDSDSQTLEKATERVKEVFRLNEFSFYVPSFEGLYEVFCCNVPGRENKLPKPYLFLTDLHVSLCMNINYSTFKSDDEGVFFSDRIYQIPFRRDIWDRHKRRIPARNSIIVSGTGGGKSVGGLNIIQQLIEDNQKVIVVEFGQSFLQLTQLYEDISLHVDYNGVDPLGINPFFVGDEKPSKEKIKTLEQLVFKFWRVKEVTEDTQQGVSLTKILEDYYEHVHTGHSFPNFYYYIQEEAHNILNRLNLDEQYFDVKGFLHVCSQFLPGGFYENVCKPSPLESEMMKKNLIVFELTKIKKDPFLVSIIFTILFDTVENKILSDRSTRGTMIFDEYAEALSIKDDANNEEVHPSVAFCYQKLRKENGAITTILQSLAQLPDDRYTKGILANTQLLYVLPTTEVVYDEVIKNFKITNESHIALMKSISNDFTGKRPYSEIFMRFQEKYATVARLELSPEKLLAFQTDGELWQKIQERYKENHSVERSIIEYLNQKNAQ
ncbi:MAG: conjugal transfer protein TraG [Bacteroidales bacterium]|jgi:hypothetical protein|nr:conjugal transfer protein TraG [Bacteroidales bacterium]